MRARDKLSATLLGPTYKVVFKDSNLSRTAQTIALRTTAKTRNECNELERPIAVVTKHHRVVVREARS